MASPARPTPTDTQALYDRVALGYRNAELFDSLDDDTRTRLIRGWRERLEHLAEDEFRYRDPVVDVSGERPA